MVTVEDEDAFEGEINVVMSLEMRKIEKMVVVVAILFVCLLGKVVRDDGGIQAEEIC